MSRHLFCNSCISDSIDSLSVMMSIVVAVCKEDWAGMSSNGLLWMSFIRFALIMALVFSRRRETANFSRLISGSSKLARTKVKFKLIAVEYVGANYHLRCMNAFLSSSLTLLPPLLFVAGKVFCIFVRS